MSKYFGTDGFRGEANRTLTADHAYTIGRFLGWYYSMLKRRQGDSSQHVSYSVKTPADPATCLNTH